MNSSEPPLIALVDVERIIDVRHRVLRDGRPRATAHFDHDAHDSATHLAMAFGNPSVVSPFGAVSIYRQASTHEDVEPAWQLRGMAVDDAHRASGHGSRLLDAALDAARARDAALVWCNARLRAVSLYERAGFRAMGDDFVIEGIGPHRYLSIMI